MEWGKMVKMANAVGKRLLEPFEVKKNLNETAVCRFSINGIQVYIGKNQWSPANNAIVNLIKQ